MVCTGDPDIQCRELFTAGRDGKIRMHEANYRRAVELGGPDEEGIQTYLSPRYMMDEHTDWVNQLLYLKDSRSRKFTHALKTCYSAFLLKRHDHQTVEAARR